MNLPKTHFELMEEHYLEYLPLARNLMKQHGWRGYFYWVRSLKENEVVSQEIARDYVRAMKNKKVARSAKQGGAYIRALLEHLASYVKNPYDMGEISSSSEFKEFYSTLEHITNSGKKEEQVFSMMLNKSWHEVCHDLAGRRVYQISPGLAQRLKNTELRGLSSNDIRLPYKAIYLAIPPEAGIQVFNEETLWHQAIGIYIIETEQSSGDRTWSILAIGASKSAEPLDDALIFFNVHLPANLPMQEVMSINEEVQKNIYVNMKEFYGDKSAFDYIISQWRALFVFCMNTVIYATWPDAEKFEMLCNPEVRKALEKMKKHPKNSKQYQRAHDTVRSQDHKKRILLGRSVSLLEPPSAEHQQGQPLTVRILVQGHWHSYWTGEGRKNKTWKFIQPYWKGPDIAAETATKRHVLV